MIKDVIWDFDGTLFDTYPAIADVFLETFRQFDIDESRTEVLEYLHQSLAETYEHFSAKHSLNNENLREKFVETEEAMDVSKALPFEGAEEILSKIIKNGGMNFIYTNRGTSTYSFLEYTGYMKYFTEIITREDGYGRKPSPDCIIYLTKKYSFNKEETLMVGDREIDVLAGYNAGIKSCYFNSHQISIPTKPHIYIDHLLELTPYLR
ncbi:MAG: HAD-IA family hydrolase [Clostridiales bacterium]|nr:HAD-IA family hydrolase [Clostridiales bacterium]